MRNEFAFLDKNENGVTTLYVDQKPYLILGGELHNSSSSNLAYMEERVWPNLRKLGLNTVLLSVNWEDVEPEEGKFDFSLLAGILQQAKREQMHLILLWFGLWKNGESFYVPAWVKEDEKRFFYAVYENGTNSNTISPFCTEAVKKDRTAFTKLMSYLKENDREHIVIMVQVENEIGFLGADRDYSQIADAQFKKEVPEQLCLEYGVNGTWQEAFGENAGEIFMSWYYANVVESIAKAGKKELSLPMYVNAWLKQHPDRAGCYPSGGPVATMIPIWKLAAPSIDFCAPDIYVRNFQAECEKYHRKDNVLFIPEAVRSAVTASNLFYAFAQHDAIGYSPFGIEDILGRTERAMDEKQLQELNITADAFSDKNTAPYLMQSYRMIDSLQEKILECRGTKKMIGYIQQNETQSGTIFSFDEYDLRLDYLADQNTKTGSAGIIFPEKNGFYIAGCNTKFTPLPKKGSKKSMHLCTVEEGTFAYGKWQKRRTLNGDEIYDMAVHEVPEMRYVRIYQKQIENR